MTTPEFLADVEETLAIYEDAIGKRATVTRRMIQDHGPVEAFSKLMQSAELQSGFKVLRDRGELNSTCEAVIVRHPKLFQKKIVEVAQWRLDHPNDLLKPMR